MNLKEKIEESAQKNQEINDLRAKIEKIEVLQVNISRVSLEIAGLKGALLAKD